MRPPDDPAPTVILATESREPSGVGRHMLELAQGLADPRPSPAASRFGRRHRVILAVPDGPGSRWLLRAAADAGIETWPLPDEPPEPQADAFGDLLGQDAVDVVHVHAGIGWEGHELVERARRAGVPAVLRTEHLPFLITTDWQDAAYRRALPLLDRLICVSEDVARSHRDAGVPPWLIRVVRNGISEPHPGQPRDAVRAAIGVAPTHRVAVTVGRLTDQKAHGVLLEAIPSVLERVADARFVWIGEGPLEEELREGIRARGLDGRITLLPHWDDVPALLAAADLLVMPSRFEGMPLVVLEAMAVGRPVVGTRVWGIEEAVVDRISGRLVPADDAPALADAVAEVLGDGGMSARMGAAGRARQAAEFAAARMVAQVGAIYGETLSAAAPRTSVATSAGTGAR